MAIQGSMHLPVVSEPGHELTLLATLEEIGLSPRPLNALSNAGVKMIGQLVLWNEYELLRLPSMGRKSVREIKETLAQLGLRLGSANVGWNTEVAIEDRQRIGAEVRRHLAGLRGHKIVLHTHVEDELEAVLGSVTTGRNRDMLRQLWGFSGHPPTTLEAVGQRYGLTRERVRQIAARARKELTRSWQETPLLEKALRLMEASLPNAAANISSSLSIAGLSRSAFSAESILLAAELLAKKHNIEFYSLSSASVLDKVGRGALLRKLPVEFRKATQANGCVSIDRLTLKCGGRLEDADGIRRILALLPETVWLDANRQWAMSTQPTRNRLSNLIQKVLTVASELHVSELRSAVSRPHRIAYTPPRTIVLEFCRQTGVAVVKGEQVGKPPDFVPASLGWVEQTLVDALKALGSPIARESVEEFCIDKCGMNVHTFYVYLSYSAVLSRLAPGVYSLVGANVPIGAVEETRSGQLQARPPSDFGWTDDGRLWCTVSLDRIAIKIGGRPLPSFVGQIAGGEWAAMFQDGVSAGMANVSENRIVGLGPSLGMAGAEHGDTLRLTFDLTTRNVLIEVGGDELRSDEPAPASADENDFEDLD